MLAEFAKVLLDFLDLLLAILGLTHPRHTLNETFGRLSFHFLELHGFYARYFGHKGALFQFLLHADRLRLLEHFP